MSQAVEAARAAVKPEADISPEEKELVRNVLGALVNLACIGGVGLVKDQQGFDLMLDALRTDVFALRYYAVAGLQNMCGHDNECAWKVVQTNSEPLLHDLLGRPIRIEVTHTHRETEAQSNARSLGDGT